MCRTERDGEPGYGCVIVEREQEGVSVECYEDKLGWRGTNTGGLGFTDVRIAADRIIGDLLTANRDLFMDAKQASSLGHAATSLGCAAGMFDKTLDYVKQRSLYGGPMHRLSPWPDRLGMAWNKIEAMRALLYTATRLLDDGRRDPLLGSTYKAWLCETAYEACNTLLHGAARPRSRFGTRDAAGIARLAQALGRLGVGKGGRVALLSGNRAEVLYVAYAAMFLEAAYVPLHPFGSAKDDVHVAADAGIDTVVFDPQFEVRVAALRRAAPGIVRLLSFGASTIGEDLLAAAALEEPRPLAPPLLNGDETFQDGPSPARVRRACGDAGDRSVPDHLSPAGPDDDPCAAGPSPVRRV